MSDEEENVNSERRIQVFVFNDQTGEYEEVKLVEDIPLYDMLNPDDILLFIEHKRSNSYNNVKFI